jgi:hypothetical protein|tara:strand:+ start:48378 stop:49589 length:1212 start_codon:yes stop_codon:yes gene_type:complete
MAFGIKADFSKAGQEESLSPVQQPEVKETAKPTEQPKVETPPTPPVEQPKPQNPKPEQPKATDAPKPIELDDAQVEAYLKSKYFQDKEFNGLDAFLKTPEPTIKEVEKVVNPYEDVIDESEEAYFKFKRDTGLGRKEWDFVQQDINSLSAMDLAVQRVRQDTGMATLSTKEAQEYLEKKLGIDFSDDELSGPDKIELNGFVKPFKDQLFAQQEEYMKPLSDEARAKQQGNANLLTLPDGRQLTKEAYQQELTQVKTDYLNAIKQGASSAAPSEFVIEFNDNGEKRTTNFKYDYSEQDKHSMLSDGSDIDAMLERRYKTEDGFDHSRLVKGLWWGDEANQKKVISAAMQQARAEVIAELSAADNNENFRRTPPVRTPKNEEGYGTITDGIVAGQQKSFGVKVNI